LGLASPRTTILFPIVTTSRISNLKSGTLAIRALHLETVALVIADIAAIAILPVLSRATFQITAHIG